MVARLCCESRHSGWHSITQDCMDSIKYSALMINTYLHGSGPSLITPSGAKQGSWGKPTKAYNNTHDQDDAHAPSGIIPQWHWGTCHQHC